MAFDAQIIHWPTLGDLTAHLSAVPRPGWCSGATVHNTYIPNEAQWRGLASMTSMAKTYAGRGWSAGPHLYLAAECSNPNDRGIWQMTPLDHQGVHAGPCNTHRLGVENVADWQARPPTPAQYELLLDVLEALFRSWGLEGNAVNVHKECMSDRTCPGQYLSPVQLRADLTARLSPPPPPPARFVRVLGATVYGDSLLTIPVTHLPAGAVVRSDAQAPAPGYAPGALHVFWDGGSGFMRADEIETV